MLNLSELFFLLPVWSLSASVLSNRLRWQICLQLGVIFPNAPRKKPAIPPPASTEINSPSSGSFFCLAIGQRPVLVSLQAREEQVIFKNRRGVQGSYLLQTSFYFITEKTQRTWNRRTFQLLIFWSFLWLSYLQRLMMSYDEPDRKIYLNQSGGQRSEHPVPLVSLHALKWATARI